MSFNRLKYDSCDYRANLSENISILDYTLDTSPFSHCSPCRNQLGLVGGNNVSITQGSMVDLENNLIGLDRPATHCPAYKWLPGQTNFQGKEYIKPVVNPTLNDKSQSLRTCQFIDYKPTPNAPAWKQFTCQM